LPIADVNGARLFYELTGAGEPLVLVHGSWGDHHNWDLVARPLAERFHVVTFDRRGHSQSEAPQGQGSVNDDVADLAALIETLDLAPAHVAGSSFGSVICLKLASRRPELFRTLAVHEPPALAVLSDDPQIKPMVEAVMARISSVVQQLESGDVPGGSRRFVEEIALGPGTWEPLPVHVKETFLRNAHTWIDEVREGPEALDLDLDALAGFTKPVLVTGGDQSPPFFVAILDRLATALPNVARYVYAGAGHVPHVTHPDDYVRTLTSFAGR
jgi:pimeloyl-ACP methyl ester carboxylesterase